ncbi:phosphopentomutase [Bradyrhizobium australiense]|uniref:Phosphopentomutase n=1 Tax=Bradyrhizobium australiense TaxID=2721161 RepID=A0A7Y4GUW8_9BRAD|nr:phosphopentomutase [Bradyrhizobium australiense]NOJ42169.1 phosphopentomutase [Bradyrhizobium australiense]
MARALVLVLDSVGIGAAPDAARYGDEGADTIGHIAEVCAHGQADRASLRAGPLRLPNLVELGLGEASRLSTGCVPPGLQSDTQPIGRYGCAAEISKGKDTPSGHWELAGVPVLFDWGYFPREVPCFAPKLISALCQQANLPGILGNCHASGTEIIAKLGEEHITSGKPICYTSADSVFQIAAHEDTFGLERLYELCTVARRLVDPLRIGRVIARPFVGSSAGDFVRTGNRRDYSVPPPRPTILDRATQAGRCVFSVGKIGDIFAHCGTGRVLKANGNAALFDRTLEGLSALPEGGLLFANFIDFDSLHGHRRDPAGYAAALEAFDARIPEIRRMMREDDLLVITADHGCDPTWRGTDHTREQVPVLLFGPSLSAGPIGRRETFADVAAAIDEHLALASASASAGTGRDMLHSRAPAL